MWEELPIMEDVTVIVEDISNDNFVIEDILDEWDQEIIRYDDRYIESVENSLEIIEETNNAEESE